MRTISSSEYYYMTLRSNNNIKVTLQVFNVEKTCNGSNTVMMYRVLYFNAVIMVSS